MYDVATLTDEAGQGPNVNARRVTEWLNETRRATDWTLVSVYRHERTTVAVWSSEGSRQG